MSETTLSREYVYSTLGTDPDLGDLVEMFVDEMPQRLEQIQECWDKSDMEGLERAAHQLKGAVGSYGFDELTPILRTLESNVKESQPEAEIISSIEAAISVCSRIRAGAPE
jgi:histidine phosphotransfer protein HptB